MESVSIITNVSFTDKKEMEKGLNTAVDAAWRQGREDMFEMHNHEGLLR